MSQYKILIIEDDPLDKEQICQTLESTAIDTEYVHYDNISEAESYDWFKNKNHFDLIILDYNLPTGVSSNFLHVQKSILKNNIPILILTGNESPVLRKNLTKYDGVHFMVKTNPNYKKLGSLVTNLLSPNGT